MNERMNTWRLGSTCFSMSRYP